MNLSFFVLQRASVQYFQFITSKKMNSISVLLNNSINIYDIKDHVYEKYGLIIRSISSIDRSFERALSVCLFGNEDEVDSISYTLSSQRDR